jgi:hypothetical protein
VIRLDGLVILGQLELLGTALDDLAEPVLRVAGRLPFPASRPPRAQRRVIERAS